MKERGCRCNLCRARTSRHVELYRMCVLKLLMLTLTPVVGSAVDLCVFLYVHV